MVPVFVTDYHSSIMNSILPPAPIKADPHAAQFQAANDPKKKFTIAHALAKVKIARSLQVLDWLDSVTIFSGRYVLLSIKLRSLVRFLR